MMIALWLVVLCYWLCGVVVWLIALRCVKAARREPGRELVMCLFLWPLSVVAFLVEHAAAALKRFAEWYAPDEEVE